MFDPKEKDSSRSLESILQKPFREHNRQQQEAITCKRSKTERQYPSFKVRFFEAAQHDAQIQDASAVTSPSLINIFLLTLLILFLSLLIWRTKWKPSSPFPSTSKYVANSINYKSTLWTPKIPSLTNWNISTPIASNMKISHSKRYKNKWKISAILNMLRKN